MHSVTSAGKISIIGSGAVGTSIAYASLIRGTAGDIVLYDIATAKVEAEVADLAHGSHFTGWPQISGGDDIHATANSDIIVVTAGAKQKPGQTRTELVSVNAGILRSTLPPLMELSPNAIVMLVTNPCDVLTSVAQDLTGLPDARVISSGTMLDSSRLRRLVADRAGVATSSAHANIVGEHGDSEFALWSQARIGSVPILDFERHGKRVFTPESLAELEHSVMRSAYKVIEGKGATNYAIGLSASRICEAILRDERSVLPISSIMRGKWGIDGIALSMPSVIGREGIIEVLDTPVSPEELERLQASAGAIRKVLDTVRDAA